jgi:hypothetical protein
MLEVQQQFEIEQFVFNDATLNTLQIRNKMVEDMKSSGAVVGSQLLEQYVYNSGDGSYTITEYDYWKNDTDRLTFTNIPLSEVRFHNAGGDNLRVTHLPSGNQITIVDMLEVQQQFEIEQFVFSDTTLNTLQIRNKMVADMKPSGTVTGTQLLEQYVHTTGDGSYTITDYDYWKNDTDRLTFTNLATTDITFSRSGTTLVMDLPGGEQVRVASQFTADARNALEQIVFTNATWNLANIAANVP